MEQVCSRSSLAEAERIFGQFCGHAISKNTEVSLIKRVGCLALINHLAPFGPEFLWLRSKELTVLLFHPALPVVDLDRILECPAVCATSHEGCLYCVTFSTNIRGCKYRDHACLLKVYIAKSIEWTVASDLDVCARRPSEGASVHPCECAHYPRDECTLYCRYWCQEILRGAEPGLDRPAG